MTQKEQDLMNKVWWAGFCRDTVEYSVATIGDEDGAKKRVAFLREHIKECSECEMAMQWKNAEMDLAVRLGPEAVSLFHNGGDLFQVYGDEARAEFGQMLTAGKFSRQMLDWADVRASRYGIPYASIGATSIGAKGVFKL